MGSSIISSVSNSKHTEHGGPTGSLNTTFWCTLRTYRGIQARRAMVRVKVREISEEHREGAGAPVLVHSSTKHYKRVVLQLSGCQLSLCERLKQMNHAGLSSAVPICCTVQGFAPPILRPTKPFHTLRHTFATNSPARLERGARCASSGQLRDQRLSFFQSARPAHISPTFLPFPQLPPQPSPCPLHVFMHAYTMACTHPHVRECMHARARLCVCVCVCVCVYVCVCVCVLESALIVQSCASVR
jgi:hypothetical protein